MVRPGKGRGVEGRGREGKDAAAAPPPGPPRSRSCSGPPAAPPGPARQAPPARRRRGRGVDAVAYTFARERVQECPGGRHLAVVPRGARGGTQAGHGARGALRAAVVSLQLSPPPPRPARPLRGPPNNPTPECSPLPSATSPCRPSLWTFTREPVAQMRLRQSRPPPSLGSTNPSSNSPAAAPPPSAQPAAGPRLWARRRISADCHASPRFSYWTLPQHSPCH